MKRVTKTTFSFLISFLMMVSTSIGIPIHALEQEPTLAETEEPSSQTPEEPSLTVQEESTEEPWYMGEKKEQNSLIHVENQTGFDIVSFQIKTKTELSYPANLIGNQEVFTAETRDLYYPIQPGQEYVAQITFSDGRVVSLDPLPLADIYERFTIRFDGQQAYIDYIQASSMQPASTASVQEAQEPTEPVTEEPVAEEPVAEEPVPQPEEETAEETQPEETTEEKKEENKEEQKEEKEEYPETQVIQTDSPELVAELTQTKGDKSSEVQTNSFAYQRLILLAPLKETIQAYGAKTAVFFQGYYLLVYDSKEKAETAFEKLEEEYGQGHVAPDAPLEVEAIGWGYDYLNMETGRQLAQEGGQVVVAVLDSGINASHEIFSGTTILEGYDFVNRDNDPADDMGHGTAVAGIIAESTPSNVVILPIKVADNKGAVATSVLMQGIHYASQNGADIMNISIGGALNSSPAVQSLFDLYSSQLADYSQPLICASGNDGVNSDEILYFPAAAPTTISVGSIKNDGARHGKSNYGNSLDFCAPGAAVRVAYSTSGSVYGTRSGTSFAAPYVSAIAADLYAAKGNLSRDGLYTELQAMSEDLGDPGKDIYYGNGCPKFEKAKLNGFVTENGKTYYYIDDVKVKGQKEIDGSWYMFDLSSGAMQTGWFNHTATTNPSGGKKRVYYNNNGQMVLGWQNISGKTYYFDPSSGAMQTGYQTIEGNWYWFNESSGVREYTGVVKNPEDNRWYFVRNGIGEKYTGTSKSITTGNYFITKDGILDWNYTGFGKAVDSGKWLFVRKGKHDATFTGVAKSIFNNQWYHGKNGVLDWNFTGLSKSVENGKWYFSRNGKLDWNFTGFGKNIENGKWVFARKGALDLSFTGVAKSAANDKWYFARKGELDWGYTGGGLSVANKKWYAVQKGSLDWSYNGTLKCTDNKTRTFKKGAAI